MLLIPQESVKQIHGDKTDLTALDKAMHKILNTKKLSDRAKWTMYSQALQRFLHVTKERRKGVKLTMLDSADPKPQEPQEPQVDKMYRLLNVTVPKRFLARAQNLFEILTDNSDITWTSSGTVTIKDTTLPRSNIVALINDVLHQRQNSNPTGWQEFVTFLKDIKVDRFILNPSRRENQTGSGIKWDHYIFAK